MMKFDTRLLKLYLNEFKRAQDAPLKVQKELLMRILRQNRNTQYGKRHGFRNIRTTKDYQERVPIVTYDDLAEEIEMIKQGKNRVLTNKKVALLATTSGTTGEPKLIPVTRERTRQLKKELMLWATFMVKRFPGLLRGKTLYFAGPPREGITAGGVVMGSISGYMAKKAPWFAKQKMVVPPEVYNEFDVDKKTNIIANLALRSNITQLGFAAPIEAILFFEYVQKHRHRLINEVLLVNPRRARKLACLPDFKPLTLWPKLQLISCIMSDNNSPYIEQLRKKIGKKIAVKDPGIYASEGRLTIGLTNHRRAGLITATENFFEFAEKVGDDEFLPPVLINQVEQGKEYKVILTTKEGLYRYDMGDVLRVVGFKKRLPIMEFVCRENFLNIVGELASENQLVRSVEDACRQLDMTHDGFTFLPYTEDLNKKPCYELLFEPKTKIGVDKANKFLRVVEEQLQENIQDYRQMRNEFGRMSHIRLAIVKRGGYQAFEKKRMTSSGQPKPIRVAKDYAFRDNFRIERTLLA
ncbi:GH3 auxin-responsive promoter family protein [Candidatus Woesearchaeota archaeon]|nr:GH3 auxin-responsive promoter family protein [Candidatus Woesearchaeota archaeon]